LYLYAVGSGRPSATVSKNPVECQLAFNPLLYEILRMPMSCPVKGIAYYSTDHSATTSG